MAALQELSVNEFTAVTISDAPAPGGGSVAALAGALGASLAGMVASLTIGKAKYADAEEEMKELLARAEEIRRELLEDIEKDTESFSAYMEAIGLPKDTEEQKAYRREKMQEGLKAAAVVPLECAKTAAKIFSISAAVVARGNKNAVTDGLVSAMMARSAVLGAVLNVKINLVSIKDEAFTADLAAQCEELEKLACAEEKRILELSDLSRTFA